MENNEVSKKRSLLPMGISITIGLVILLYVYVPASGFELSPESDDVIVIYGDN